MRPAHRPGFTLIEMLIVIAIIALLAGITFPMVATVREGGQRTGCMEKMRQLVQAAKLYKEDHGVYPEALFGYEAWEDQGGTPVRVSYRYLYPQYLKSKTDFRCPRSEWVTRPTDAEEDCLWPGTLMNVAGQPRTNQTDPTKQIYYFPWQTYDANINPNVRPGALNCGTLPASPFANMTNGAPLPHAEVHYRRLWAVFPVGDPRAFDPRQLSFRTPSEQTVVTWCMNHYKRNALELPEAGSLALVAFLDGRVQSLSAERMMAWDNQDGNAWLVHPRP